MKNTNSQVRVSLSLFVITVLAFVTLLQLSGLASVGEVASADCPYRTLGFSTGTSRVSIIEKFQNNTSSLTERQMIAYNFLINQNGIELFENNKEEYLVRAIEVGFYKEMAVFLSKDGYTGRKTLLSRIARIPSGAYKSVRENFLNMHTANFYMAMATISFLDSLNDPLEFKSFLESLKYPEMHIGFFLFCATSSKTNALFYKITQGKVDARYLGLSAGVIVLSFFTDIYYHPLRQKIKETKDYKIKFALWGQVLADLFLTKDKWVERGASIFCIIAVSKGLTIAHEGITSGAKILLKKSGKTIIVDGVENVAEKGVAGAIGRFIGKKVIPKGIKIIYTGGKLSSVGIVLSITGEIVQTVLFLEGVDLLEGGIEPPVKRFFKTGDIIAKRKIMNDIVDNFFTNSQDTEIEKIEQSISDFRMEFLSYRQLLLTEYIRKYNLWLKELDEIEFENLQRRMFLLWIARGMDENDKEFVANDGDWHKETNSDDFKEQQEKWLKRFIHSEPILTVSGESKPILSMEGFPILDGTNYSRIKAYISDRLIPKIKSGYYLKDVEQYVLAIEKENKKKIDEMKTKYSEIVKPIVATIANLKPIDLSTRFELSQDVIGSLVDEYYFMEKPYLKYRLYWNNEQYIKILALFFTGPQNAEEEKFFELAAKKLGFQQIAETHLADIRNQINFAVELKNWITLEKWPNMDSFLGLN